jgi:hypothetical protein
MSQTHVNKNGECIYCGAKLKRCQVCFKNFYSTRSDHTHCSDKCRKKKQRAGACIT